MISARVCPEPPGRARTTPGRASGNLPSAAKSPPAHRHFWRVRGQAPHAPPGADRDKPGLWAHVLSKERTLGYIAT
eukprot:scaffold88526_cov49-Phaeocystis_antarctica.AAC.1